MKLLLLLCLAATVHMNAFGQSKVAAKNTEPKPAAGLQSALKLMDGASMEVHSVKTKFQWDDYESAIDEHEFNQGVLYFSREKGKIQFAADIQQGPESPKYILYKDDTLRVYVKGGMTPYDVKKHKAIAESLLVLGFGGAGRDLRNVFDVRYVETERIGDTTAHKLELIPKDADVRKLFPSVVLWIDSIKGIAVQQKIDKGAGSYRIVKYSNTLLNPPKLPREVFSETR